MVIVSNSRLAQWNRQRSSSVPPFALAFLAWLGVCTVKSRLWRFGFITIRLFYPVSSWSLLSTSDTVTRKNTQQWFCVVNTVIEAACQIALRFNIQLVRCNHIDNNGNKGASNLPQKSALLRLFLFTSDHHEHGSTSTNIGSPLSKRSSQGRRPSLFCRWQQTLYCICSEIILAKACLFSWIRQTRSGSLTNYPESFAPVWLS